MRLTWRLHRALRSARLHRAVIAILLIWCLIDVVHVRRSLSRAAADFATQSLPAAKKPRVFIASLHWNNEAILRSHWNDGVIKLARALGPENVFVSVQESGSWDDSKAALRELDERLGQLGVQRRILLDERTHEQDVASNPGEEGWIMTSRGKKELRRIPYLAKLRNLTLKPLKELQKNGTIFDKVLFLGDVVFTTEDVFALLNTNGGDYAAACSLDFGKPPLYYDTFALRDSEGHEHAMQTWPYFRARESRAALKAGLPVPVSSCWNGMVFMPAASFTGPGALTFRGVSDSLASQHLEGSECCLIHADHPLSPTMGVYLNPNVRVGYSASAYDAVHPKGHQLGILQILYGLWRNRFRRWFTTSFLKESVVLKRVRAWEAEDPSRSEKGTFCLINEMQVLVENGWAHV